MDSISDKKLLEWELSLESSDIRSASWYHGDVPRPVSELLLEEDGEFLVRDSSTFSKSGDYVLSTKWNGTVLHFLIHKEVLQPDTIYEKLGYRFENESFTTVQDLITCYVGNRDPISARSGAIISLPRTRNVPVSRKRQAPQVTEPIFGLEHAEYATVSQMAPVDAQVIIAAMEKPGTTEVSLNLKQFAPLLEDLANVPDKIANLEAFKRLVLLDPASEREESFDLTAYSSVLIPVKMEEALTNPDLLNEINSRILEASQRAMAYHMTYVDMKILRLESSTKDDDSPDSGGESNGMESVSQCKESQMYEGVLDVKGYRWKCIIERSLTLSHFVAFSILGSEGREEMFNKWICIASELKMSLGNFFSFCAIMRGLTCTKLNGSDGPVDWIKLRRDYTTSAFEFETSLKKSYFNLQQCNESYPPNLTIPDLFPMSVIMEDNLALFPMLQNSTAEEQVKLTTYYLRQFYALSDNYLAHNRNWERVEAESTINLDLVLSEICRTETQLLILWGGQYNAMNMLERCLQFDDSFR